MKAKHMLIAALAALTVIVVGCKSVEVERKGQEVAVVNDQLVKDKDGNPIILDRGWRVDYFQHWNWQRFDSLEAKAGEATLNVNNYSSGADSNLTALVSTSFKGACELTARIGAAIATSGGSVAGEAGASAISALVSKFISKGGDASNANITCKDGSCTLTDGIVSETCTNCYDH